MKNVHEVRMPDIGDAKDVGVIEILVKAGDAVLEGQTLIIVETDKASMEIPSPQTGVLQSLTVGLDDKISEGSPIALIESEGRSPAPAPLIEPVAALAEPRQEVSAPSLIEVREPPTDSPLASPSVRQFSRELGVSLINSPEVAILGMGKSRERLALEARAGGHALHSAIEPELGSSRNRWRRRGSFQRLSGQCPGRLPSAGVVMGESRYF